MTRVKRDKIINSPDPLAYVLADALLQASEKYKQSAVLMLGVFWGFTFATALGMAFFLAWRLWL